MFSQYDIPGIEEPPSQEESQLWADELEHYLRPYSQRLDAYLDRRVVGNLTAVVAGIVQTRTELTTSELGSAITGPAHAEAGTQRLQRALHHEGWKASIIEEVLWEQAEQRRQELESRGETPLCIWDSSVLEKPESEHLQGLGTVRTSRVESLHLRDWEPRRKLLLLVTLAYGFLLWVLAPGFWLARSRLLVH